MRPYTIAFVTSTLNAVIGKTGERLVLSCRDDFRLLHKLRAEVDAVMVGANTVVNDNPRLTVRLVSGVSPIRVVVDSKLKVDVRYEVFKTPEKSVLITSTKRTKRELRKFIEHGVKVISVPELPDGSLDLVMAMSKLRRMGVKRLLVEGGGILLYTLLREGLVDELRVTIAPKIMSNGIPLVRPLPGLKGGLQVELKLSSLSVVCSDWVHLKYIVLRPKRALT